MINSKRRLPTLNYTLSPFKVNLGCGTKPLEGYIGMDIVDFGQEFVWNILEGIPLADSSVSEFKSHHFVGHFTFLEFGLICEEMWRVGIDKCIIHMHVPLRTCARAYRPTHTSFWDKLVVEGFFIGFVDEKHNRTNQFTVLSAIEKDDGMLSFRVQVNK